MNPHPSLSLELCGRRFRVMESVDLAIPLDFDGPQPSHFGAPPATREAMREGGFVGDTRRGAGCNVAVLHLNPHCNGTHTESLGHITDTGPDVAAVTGFPPLAAMLVSVDAVAATDCREAVDPATDDGDRLITAAAISQVMDDLALDDLAEDGPGPEGSVPEALPALVVRTRPNPPAKRYHRYGEEQVPPYFSLDAMALMVERGVRHLVCDLPSVDRMHDEGRLLGHRIFWGVPEGSTDAGSAKRADATITELAYIPDSAADGLYLLDLQVAAFLSDAAPSRPLLHRLEPIADDPQETPA